MDFRVSGKRPTVYIVASQERGTLYVGVTGNLKLRIWEHREGLVAGFTNRYGVKRLVWYEWLPDFPSAIRREKQIKKWNRETGIDRGWQPCMERILGKICVIENENGFPLARE